MAAAKIITLKVLKPLLAGMRDDYFNIRVYRKADGSDVKIFNKEDESRKELKDYIKCEYVFPRNPVNNEIDWFLVFAHSIETYLKKEANASYVKILSITPEVKLFAISLIFRGIISGFEAIAPGSVIRFITETDAKDGNYVGYFGRFRNKGFGESLIEIKSVEKK